VNLGSGGFAALAADQHDVGNMHGRFDVNDPCLPYSRSRLAMSLHHVEPVDDNHVIAWHDAAHLASLAIVLAHKDLYSVILPDIHDCSL
jgi:hypothetical protein